MRCRRHERKHVPSFRSIDFLLRKVQFNTPQHILIIPQYRDVENTDSLRWHESVSPTPTVL